MQGHKASTPLKSGPPPSPPFFGGKLQAAPRDAVPVRQWGVWPGLEKALENRKQKVSRSQISHPYPNNPPPPPNPSSNSPPNKTPPGSSTARCNASKAIETKPWRMAQGLRPRVNRRYGEGPVKEPGSNLNKHRTLDGSL